MGKKTAAPAAEKVEDKKQVKPAQPEEKAKDNKQQPQQPQQGGKGKGKANNTKEVKEVVKEEVKEEVKETTPGKPDRELDEVEKVITARIGRLDDEIRAHRAEIDSIQASIDEKKLANKALQEEQSALKTQSREVGDSQGISTRYTNKIGEIKEIQRIRKNKYDEQKKMRDSMGPSVDQKDYVKHLEADIRALQDRQASGDIVNMQEEKKIISEISKLTSNKKLYKSYAEVVDTIAQLDKQIDTLRAELAKIDEEHSSLREKKKVFEDQVTIKRSKHDDTSKLIDQDYTKKKELVAKVNELEKKKNTEYDGLRTYRTDRREKATKKREEEQKKRQDDKKAAEAKRQQEEDAKGFYADELDACNQLLAYLEPLKYTPPEPEAEKEEEKEGESEEKKEEEEGTSSATPAPAAEERPKRGGKKKPAPETDKERELKHTAQTFFHFELVSLVAPVNVGGVEDSIAQINEKKAYLEKKQEERKDRRKALANGRE